MKKQSTSGQGKRRVVFSLTAPKAEAVSLAGDFNQWHRDKHPMKMTRDGRWTKAIYLTPGTYEYKYWVDGSWRIDERNANSCPNCYGTRNNLIIVDAKQR